MNSPKKFSKFRMSLLLEREFMNNMNQTIISLLKYLDTANIIVDHVEEYPSIGTYQIILDDNTYYDPNFLKNIREDLLNLEGIEFIKFNHRKDDITPYYEMLVILKRWYY